MYRVVRLEVTPLSSKFQKKDVPLPKLENAIVKGAVPFAGLADAIANAGAVSKSILKNTNITSSEMR